MVQISIVIPTLNEEKYIEKTLRSIRNQNTKKSYEVIIVDSYSKDKTPLIAKKYGCKIVNCPPGIIAMARQKGFDVAEGKILVCANADTIYPRNWLERLTKPIFAKKAVASCGNLTPLDGNTIERIFTKRILHPIASISFKLGMHYAPGETIAFTRESFNKIKGFNVRLKTAEDMDLIKRISKHGKVAYVPDAMVYISMRRIRKWGYFYYITFHTTNFISINLLNRGHDKYEPIR